jgi:hypothetical protein
MSNQIEQRIMIVIGATLMIHLSHGGLRQWEEISSAGPFEKPEGGYERMEAKA